MNEADQCTEGPVEDHRNYEICFSIQLYANRYEIPEKAFLKYFLKLCIP